jgi:hypothetical protein
VIAFALVARDRARYFAQGEVMKPLIQRIIGMAVVLALFSAFWWWLSTKNPRIFVEHGPMENFQAICITLGLLIFLWQMYAVAAPGRIVFAGLALFYGTFVVVEFDTRELGWRAAAVLLNGPIRDAWLAALWILLGIWAFRYRRDLIPIGRAWLSSATGLFLGAAGLFWIAAGIVDKLKLLGSPSRNLLGEELLETNAALLMLLAAVAARFVNKRPTVASAAEPYARELPKPQDSRE